MTRGDRMKQFLLHLLPMIMWICGSFSASFASEKEFLTDIEIETIQLNQEINLRVKFYLEFAESRLKAAEDRLNGIEPVEGDPFELMTPEDMLDGYYGIFRSIMMNLDDANQNPNPRVEPKIRQALKALKDSTKKNLTQLEILKKISEEKLKEDLWNRVNRAIDITNGAHEGAENALSKNPEPANKKPNTR
jgi:hypothetical protein